ncbi:hypothetical protein [Neobacillus thermocopriae]|uniref:Uncharacterized protein n=1 Tax=Neobacillus thermocopriae TaxID=1215031 RepID=A0A6B3TN70_9BACI|nr:hypothetical protein [Neobacillus thermocopriae]MED3622653.1 hypothetical protein [Neobacillus thermocopriae]MED3714257.1 hypothetical protein [Neobacillus thermocopriae]NEX77796.1 hypothetical protein [Neobacillus thermocopriae]
MNRDYIFIIGMVSIILFIVFLFFSFKTKKALFYTLSILTFILCVGVGIIYYSLPLHSDALHVEEKNNGVYINWKNDFLVKQGKYNILISEGKNNTIKLKNVDLEKIRQKELFSEAAKNDYHNLYLSFFEKSDFYNQEKGYEYFIIPSNYEGLIQVSNTNTNLYYMYLYPEMMGPTRPYWIKKLNE